METALSKLQNLSSVPSEYPRDGIALLSSSQVDDLKSLLRQTEKYYPAQEFEQETKTLYLHDYARLTAKYGATAVRGALEELRMKPEQKFFPLPREVNGVLIRWEDERIAELRKYKPDPQCVCKGSGDYQPHFLRGTDLRIGVRACACRIAHEALLKTLPRKKVQS